MTDRPDPREATIRLAALKVLRDKVSAAYDQARHDAREALDPGDRKTAYLPSGASIGTVTYTDGKTTAKIIDEAAFLAWVQRNAPDEIVTTKVVRWSYTNAVMSRCVSDDGEAIHGETGEVIPGIGFVTSASYVSARQSDEQLEAFVKAYTAGELATTLGALVATDLLGIPA